MKAECSSDVLRMLSTWSDRILAQDWSSALKPMPPAGDPEELERLVLRYIELRRGADNWSPRRYDRNNHQYVSNEDVVALLLDARSVDKAQGRPSRAATWRRSKFGKQAECVVCRGTFVAARRSARYCSEICKQRAKRARESRATGPETDGQTAGGQDPHDTLTLETGPSDGPDPDGAA